ncbi:MAG: class I poly(R)-hydroxyalkanoic acid synthase [Alphaproteobacteria bacterium]|nr:class I poly(R)-hydroxyalkanoic acid synthase [Alphaproteobacteria bacterium]
MTGRSRKSASAQKAAAARKAEGATPTRAKPPEAAAAAPAEDSPAPKPAAKPAAPPPAGKPVSVRDLMASQTRETLERLSANLADAMTRANNVFSTAFQDQSANAAPMRADPFDVNAAVSSVWRDLAQKPETLRAAHADLWRQFGEIWQSHAMRYMQGPGAIEPAAIKDRRFKDPEWQTDPFFSLMRETYLATAGWVSSLVEQADGVDPQAKRKAAFFIKQAVDAASPSNFLLTNPTILRATLEQSGENLRRGLDNLSGDLRRGKGFLSISQADPDAFEVGVNLATTPGKVVFRNRIIEILQYTPTTTEVLKTPLLIFPPWINKFYIMDLQPKNSMIRWLLSKGHTVFLASWVNPDEQMAEKTFEDYMQEGVYAAVQAVQDATGEDRMNTVGYCIGGTLLASTLAYMAKHGDARIQSATFFASQTDFELSGDLMIFSDAPGVSYLRERMEAKGGLLDAQAMADTFNSLRSNDLIWNYVVDNYYLGNQPPPFDLLYWNSDQTRMPRALHLFYLTTFYQANALAKGELSLLGEPVSLGDVKIPIYMQSSREDHIAPYPSVYRGAKRFGGPVRFMMAGSGHIAGVINHPDANKYQHWINPDLPSSIEEWVAGAQETPGSWWPDWHAWLTAMSGPMVPARTPGEGALQVLGDAPGEYVKVKSITG